MQNLYVSWISLFDKYSQLLSELEQSLRLEKKALLSNNIDLLKDATLHKDKVTRIILQLKTEMDSCRKKAAQELGLDENISLLKLFDTLAPGLSKDLIARRSDLLRRSKAIQKTNAFNQRCLSTYMSFIDGMNRIIAEQNPDYLATYAPGGNAYDKVKSGRLISRSL